MYDRIFELKLTHEHEQLLRDTTIDEDGPGTILRDFESLLSYIGEKKLQLTKTYKLRLPDVRELNARFTTPLQLGLRRPAQKSYPHIHGLYLLVRSSELTYVEHVGKKKILHLNQDVYQVWQSLNPTERYATLLETWITRADPELIGERCAPFGSIGNLYPCLILFRKLSEEEAQTGDQESIESTIRYVVGDYNLGIIDSFGLVKAEFGPPKAKTGWYLKRLTHTPFGNALLSLLVSKLRQALEHSSDSDEEDNLLNSLQSILQPYFPEWQKSLTVSDADAEESFQEGTHIFKVSLGNIWRRIAISADNNLDTFAYAILRAVNFDNDHLYNFTYRDRFGMQVEINHPYMSEGELTNEVEIGDLALYAGQTMTFLFDFGDDWKFNITFERLETEMEIDGPVLLEEHGEAPEQYESWDEEEEE